MEKIRKVNKNIISTCPTCETKFDNPSGRKVYCKPECRPRIQRCCPNCGIDITQMMHNTKFCSVACRKANEKKLVNEKRREKFSDNELVKCLECNLHFTQLSSHLFNTHGMSVDEYLTKHPGAKMVSDKLSKVYSDKFSGENNPGYQHGGRLSVFSKNFKGYDGMDDGEKETVIDHMIGKSLKKK